MNNSEDVKRYKECSIPYQVAKLKVVTTRVFGRLLKKNEIDLTPEQAQVLGLLLEKQQCCMNDISLELLVDNSAVTRLVDTLERKNFVKRIVAEHDRRQRMITITERGQQEIAKTALLAKNHKSKLLNGISAEDKTLFLSLLGLMRENMEECLVELETE
ncbi:MAG: MarR family transcriptional regulator [Flavobacteriaceae bacterium]|nr:MarR family transcriptional regulator [Flavobacteriaceae bacterium]